MFNRLFILSIFLLSSCNTLDNYMLGADNTPAPRPLKPLKSHVDATPKWRVQEAKKSLPAGKDNLHSVIVHDVVYTADHTGKVVALNKHNGQIQWQKQLGHVLLSGPSIGSGILVLGTDDARLIALKAQNGEILWQQSLSGNAYASPVIGYGRVLAKTIDGHLYAFDLQQGKKQWVAKHGSPELVLKAASKPVIVNANQVIAAFADGKIDAYNLDDGMLLWSRRVVYGNGASEIERLVDIDTDPIIQNKTIYFGSYHRFVGAMSLEDGHMLWEKPISVYKNMTLNQGMLYLVDLNDIVWAINSNSGEVVWKQTALKHHGLTSPVIKGSFVVVGDSANMVHWLSSSNGQLKGRVLTQSEVNAAPIFSGRDMIVATAGGLSAYTMKKVNS